jgi:fatty-acyl-CoA synthase
MARPAAESGMGFIQRLKSEFEAHRCVLRALRMTTPIARNPTRVFATVVEELATRFGEREALVSGRERLTYRELDQRANCYARWARREGLAKGDVVCLLMSNRPEYIAIWVGLTRIGVVVALLNTNLSGGVLAHCISIVAPKHVIVAADLYGQFRTMESQLAGAAKIWLHGAVDDGLPRIDTVLAAIDGSPLKPDERPRLTIEDRALYVYTSGTTGMPKAANVNHYRLMAITHGFAGAMNTRADDRMYVCLPMYHTVGGVLAPGAVMLAGGTAIIRERFSAREFWDDIVRFDCTLFQYIGELCRYLVTAPPCPAETRHRIRLCCGNGLRPDIWQAFQQRFRIPRIIEFYAATEGNVALFNFDGTPGAVGRIPWWMAHRFPVAIVKFDVEREEPVRGPDGFCVRCAPNEAGELISKIVNDPSKPANRFEGYADPEATKKKVLRDAFEKGDQWFRTGDLMRQDERGYFYFVDRIGDTFRWKGENVSTTEVAETITIFPGVKDATVYGVKIEGYEGSVGMAAVVAEHKLDLAALREHLVRSLPDYARPSFLRIRTELEVTGTFKQRKLDLVREGFDPLATTDAIFFNDPLKRSFNRLDATLYERIRSGAVRM